MEQQGTSLSKGPVSTRPLEGVPPALDPRQPPYVKDVHTPTLDEVLMPAGMALCYPLRPPRRNKLEQVDVDSGHHYESHRVLILKIEPAVGEDYQHMAAAKAERGDVLHLYEGSKWQTMRVNLQDQADLLGDDKAKVEDPVLGGVTDVMLLDVAQAMAISRQPVDLRELGNIERVVGQLTEMRLGALRQQRRINGV